MVVSGLFGVLVLVTGVGILKERVAALYAGILLAAAFSVFSGYRVWQGDGNLSSTIAAGLGLLALVLFLIAWWQAHRSTREASAP